MPTRAMGIVAADLRRLFACAMLALLFVLAQHQALRHGLAHTVESLQKHKPAAPTQLSCSDCSSLASFGAALPSSPTAHCAPPDGGHLCGAAKPKAAPDAEPPAAYESRAPPARA